MFIFLLKIFRARSSFSLSDSHALQFSSLQKASPTLPELGINLSGQINPVPFQNSTFFKTLPLLQVARVSINHSVMPDSEPPERAEQVARYR